MISDACEYIMSHGKGELSEQMGKCQSPNIKMGRLYRIIQTDLIKSQGSSNVTEDGGRVSVRVVQWEQGSTTAGFEDARTQGRWQRIQVTSRGWRRQESELSPGLLTRSQVD